MSRVGMKYLMYVIIAFVFFIYNVLDIDPYTNQINFVLFSEVAPKSIVKATSAYGYADSLVKIGSSLYCIKNTYDLADVTFDKPLYSSEEYKLQEKRQIDKFEKSCKLASKINDDLLSNN